VSGRSPRHRCVRGSELRGWVGHRALRSVALAWRRASDGRVETNEGVDLREGEVGAKEIREMSRRRERERTASLYTYIGCLECAMLDSIFALSFHSIKLVPEYNDCDPSSNSPFPRVQPVSPATNRPQFSVCNVEARHLSLVAGTLIRTASMFRISGSSNDSLRRCHAVMCCWPGQCTLTQAFRLLRCCVGHVPNCRLEDDTI
jgi:hypothetical protein